jgi:hypothetical protein
MTLNSIKEYAEAIRSRYRKANKEQKGKILDEFIKTTGYHRKAAIRLLLKNPPLVGHKRGRVSCYQSVVGPLKVIWEATDRLCSKRLQPFLPEMIRVLLAKQELQLNADIEAKLIKLSPATMDRLLKPYRSKGGRKSRSTTQSVNLLKNLIPIRTFGDWKENRPGFLEIDLVAHCGESTDGFYLHTLSAVDVASGWFECLPVWGKGQTRVRAAVHHIRQQLPFRLQGIDSDNGTEFINQCFFGYCQKEKITFTRSRAYKKNDGCHVEQKNGNVIRRLVGYERYSSHAAYKCLERLYYTVRLYLNFFQPTMKLISKTRHGAKVHKVYETAQTPYQRLLKLGLMSPARQAELFAIFSGLNPVLLLRQINANLSQLWKLADRSSSSVTPIMRQ